MRNWNLTKQGLQSNEPRRGPTNVLISRIKNRFFLFDEMGYRISTKSSGSCTRNYKKTYECKEFQIFEKWRICSETDVSHCQAPPKQWIEINCSAHPDSYCTTPLYDVGSEQPHVRAPTKSSTSNAAISTTVIVHPRLISKGIHVHTHYTVPTHSCTVNCVWYLKVYTETFQQNETIYAERNIRSGRVCTCTLEFRHQWHLCVEYQM